MYQYRFKDGLCLHRNYDMKREEPRWPLRARERVIHRQVPRTSSLDPGVQTLESRFIWSAEMSALPMRASNLVSSRFRRDASC